MDFMIIRELRSQGNQPLAYALIDSEHDIPNIDLLSSRTLNTDTPIAY